MNCDEIKSAIEDVFKKLKLDAKGGNITDSMVTNSDFNKLKELAHVQCNIDYEIKFTNEGWILVSANWR